MIVDYTISVENSEHVIETSYLSYYLIQVILTVITYRIVNYIRPKPDSYFSHYKQYVVT